MKKLIKKTLYSFFSTTFLFQANPVLSNLIFTDMSQVIHPTTTSLRVGYDNHHLSDREVIEALNTQVLERGVDPRQITRLTFTHLEGGSPFTESLNTLSTLLGGLLPEVQSVKITQGRQLYGAPRDPETPFPLISVQDLYIKPLDHVPMASMQEALVPFHDSEYYQQLDEAGRKTIDDLSTAQPTTITSSGRGYGLPRGPEEPSICKNFPTLRFLDVSGLDLSAFQLNTLLHREDGVSTLLDLNLGGCHGLTKGTTIKFMVKCISNNVGSSLRYLNIDGINDPDQVVEALSQVGFRTLKFLSLRGVDLDRERLNSILERQPFMSVDLGGPLSNLESENFMLASLHDLLNLDFPTTRGETPSLAQLLIPGVLMEQTALIDRTIQNRE